MTFELQYGILALPPWGQRHSTQRRIRRHGQRNGLRTPPLAERRSPERKEGWNGLPRRLAGLLCRHQVGGVMTLKSCYESMKEQKSTT